MKYTIPVLITSLSLISTSALAAPALFSTELDSSLSARSPILGFVFRGGARAARQLPGKAGKQSAKQQAKHKGESAADKERIDDMTARMSRITGKPQDRECVKSWHNQLSRTGGFNAVVNCAKDRHKKSWWKRELENLIEVEERDVWGEDAEVDAREEIEESMDIEGRDVWDNEELVDTREIEDGFLDVEERDGEDVEARETFENLTEVEERDEGEEVDSRAVGEEESVDARETLEELMEELD